eukprot:CFRG3631T1
MHKSAEEIGVGYHNHESVVAVSGEGKGARECVAFPLLRLPDEVLIIVLGFLSSPNILNVRSVCRRLRNITSTAVCSMSNNGYIYGWPVYHKLADMFPNLEELEVEGDLSRLAESLRKLKRLRKLFILSDHANSATQEVSFWDLSTCAAQLQSLEITDWVVADRILPFLHKLGNLHTLNLSEIEITHDNLRDIVNIQSLVYLNLGVIPDNTISSLVGMKNLKCPTFSGPNTNFANLASLTTITGLFICSEPVTQNFQPSLHKLTNLKQLTLRGVQDVDVESIARNLKGLNALDLSECELRNCRGLQTLGELKSLHFQMGNLNNEHLQQMDGLAISYVNIYGNEKITSAGLYALRHCIVVEGPY